MLQYNGKRLYLNIQHVLNYEKLVNYAINVKERINE